MTQLAYDFRLIVAQVVSVNTKNRTVDVSNVSGQSRYRGVRIISSLSTFSLPKEGEYGVVMGSDPNFYFLGRLDNDYSKKIKGEYKDTKGNKIKGLNVSPGESTFLHQLTRTALRLLNNHNFYLLTALSDGISYTYKAGFQLLRAIKVLGQTVVLQGASQKVQVGTVLRNDPTGAEYAVTSPTTTTNGSEFLVDLISATQQSIAKFNLGDIFASVNPPTPTSPAVGVPEYGSFGAPPLSELRALLSIYSLLGIPLASLKIDSIGNIELTSALTGGGGDIVIAGDKTVSITGGVAGTVTLGTIGSLTHAGTAPSIEAAVLGTTFKLWLDAFLIWAQTHTHPTSTGPSGMSIPQPTAIPVILSTKVFVA